MPKRTHIMNEMKAFLWGAASFAYQVEGGYDADGRGPSKGDIYTNRDRITVPFTGRQETGNVAIKSVQRAAVPGRHPTDARSRFDGVPLLGVVATRATGGYWRGERCGPWLLRVPR